MVRGVGRWRRRVPGVAQELGEIVARAGRDDAQSGRTALLGIDEAVDGFRDGAVAPDPGPP